MTAKPVSEAEQAFLEDARARVAVLVARGHLPAFVAQVVAREMAAMALEAARDAHADEDVELAWHIRRACEARN